MQSRTERYKQMTKLPFYKKKSFLISLMTIGILLAGLVGYYGYSLYHAMTRVTNPAAIPSAAKWSGTDRVNILVLGVDNRNNDPHPRSDAMIIISLDPKTKTAVEFSVMRDTYYKIPGHGYEKINAAFAIGGPDLAIKTVSDFLQIPINYYIKTDFQGFEKVVDTIGGVTINVEKDMVYADDGVYDINLHKGLQRLDGQHALMYVRFRHDATSDFTRTERQRNFLKALAKEMETPKSLVQLPSIVNAMAPYVDTNMSISDMVKLGNLAYSMKISNMEAVQIPPTEALKDANIPDIGDVLVPDVYQSRVIVHEKLGLTDPVPNNSQDQPVVPNTRPLTPEEAPPTPTKPAAAPHSGGSSTTGSNGNSVGSYGNQVPGSGNSGTGTNGAVLPLPGGGINVGTGGAGTGSGSQTGGSSGTSGTGSSGTGSGGTNPPSSSGGSGSTNQPKSGTTGSPGSNGPSAGSSSGTASNSVSGH